MEPKVTYTYENEENPNRCVVRLYEEYIKHRPESSGLRGSTAFYLTPIKSPTSNCWYKSVPMGINTITSALKRLTSSVNDGKLYINTRMHRTAKTRVAFAGIPKEIAARKTGHSSNCDLTYVESREEQEKTMSEMLCGVSSKVIKVNTSKVDSHLGRIFTDN